MSRIEKRREGENISSRQFQRMMIIELLGGNCLILPALVVRLGGKNGLAVFLLGAAMAVLVAVYFLWAGERWDRAYGNQITDRYGTVGSGVYVVLYSIRFFLHGLFLMILFTALIGEVLLPEQNRAMILLPVLVLIFYATRKNLTARARRLEFLFWYVVIPVFIAVILALFQVNFSTLPAMLWGEEQSWSQTLYGGYGILMVFAPLEFLLFLAPATDSKEKKGILMGRVFLFVIAWQILILIGTVGLFGTVRTGEKLWSALWMMQSVRLPGHFLERFDILFLAVWIFGMFALASGYLFYSETLVSAWRKSCGKEKRGWMYPVIFLAGLFLGALWAGEPETVLPLFGKYLMWLDVPLALLLPLFLRFRRKKKRKILLLSLLGGLLLLTGCRNGVDIEDKNYVMTLGIDAGTEKKLAVTYEVADFNQPTGEGEGGDSQGGKSASYQADTLAEAEETEGKYDEKQLDFGHVKAIVFSRQIIQNEAVWNQVLEELSEKTNLAGTVLVFQAEGDVASYLSGERNGSDTLGEYLEQRMTNHGQETEQELTLGTLLRNVAEGEQIRMPVLKQDGEMIFVESELSSQVLRFHIRADSDQEEAQELKLKVKDKVVVYLQNLLEKCQSKEDCITVIEQNLDQIQETAETACREEGGEVPVIAYLTRESFPLKQYGDMIFPSGTYDALRIDLGKGEGKNWWCMMYPSLCMVDGIVEEVPEESKETLRQNLSQETYASLFWEKRNDNGEEKSEEGSENEKEGSGEKKEKDGEEESSEEGAKKITFHVKWKVIEELKQWFATRD